MKTNRSNANRNEGSVLLVTMTVLAVAAIALGSYLLVIQNQTASVSRSQTWNSAIAVSEAGVEDALGLINKDAPFISNGAWDWTNSARFDGWTPFANGATSRSRTVYGTSTYNVTVTVTNLGSPPEIASTASVPLTQAPWVFSSLASPFVAAGNVQTTTTQPSMLTRKVKVQTVLVPLFTAAVITKSNFNMNGNSTTVDSFDSTNVLYSLNGQYSPLLRRANGDIATDSGVIGDINLGNGNIYGHVYTGAGTAQSSVAIGSQGAVGDLTWNTSHTGIQSGYWNGNFNVTIPDVPAPTFSPFPLPAASNGVITLNGGTYNVTSVPNTPLNITGPTKLWVQGSFTPSGLTIASTNNASLSLFVGTANASGNDSISIGGNGALNSPGLAENFQIFGLPSLTSITFSGNAGFSGTIYAPEAALSGNGGGNNTLDTVGAMIVKSVTLNGHWNFHYDEALRTRGKSRGWIAKNWTEQAPTN
ncbi:MAG: hypothetical protein JWR26_702 [Pedosphaera sp.]|nr:hypothetical protein [Pedosphaera sp.]